MHLDPRALQLRPQAQQDVGDVVAEREAAPRLAGLVDRDLLEAAHEAGGAIEVELDDAEAFPAFLDEGVELAATNVAACEQRFEPARFLGEMRAGGQCDAQRRVDFVGDTGDQAVQRSMLLGVDQLLLGVAELAQRGLQLAVLQRELAGALGDLLFQ